MIGVIIKKLLKLKVPWVGARNTNVRPCIKNHGRKLCGDLICVSISLLEVSVFIFDYIVDVVVVVVTFAMDMGWGDHTFGMLVLGPIFDTLIRFNS